MADPIPCKEIYLAAVDLKDHAFVVPSGLDYQRLATSMGEVGLLAPPWLRARPERRWQVVAGLKRLLAAAQLGWERLPARILPASTPEQPAIAIHGNDWTPKMMQMAKAGIIVSNSVSLVVFVGDDNLENRFRKLCRYTLGLVELMNAGQSAMGYVVKLSGPVALSDSMIASPFLQAMTLNVLLEQAESY